jgi:asparagine synthase (glutamine-hydrolysing)
MCGIFGTVNMKLDGQRFLHELNKIRHRGPDGFGVWKNSSGLVNFGHRRLAVIDKDERSNQPMVLGNRFVIVYNGEIYNYLELRRELENEGESFDTASDTEVLLKLIVKKGPNALSKLNGMWAFAIYDNVENTIFLSRDRLGKKPLYYFSLEDKFAFSSEMKNLVSLIPNVDYNIPFIDFTVTHVSEAENFEDTIYEGIKKFPKGSYGIYKDGRLKTELFYDPLSLVTQKRFKGNFSEATECFIELFESSCRLRMRSDVSVGSALSGGVDSSFLVSTIAKMGFSNDGYSALVSSFPGSFLDETKDAINVANHSNISVDSVVVDKMQDPNNLLKYVYHFEDIAGTYPGPFFQLYTSFRDRKILVTLDGHGSDELFGGYAFDLFGKVRDDFPNFLKMKQTLDSIDKMLGFNNEISFKNAWPYFRSEVKTKFKALLNFRIATAEHYYQNRLFHATFNGMLPTLLRNYDKYSMYAGVEVRMPFLDHRIVEFAFSLPNEYKLRNGFSKAIVRNAAASIVPKYIIQNKIKTGWNSPMGEWFVGPWRQWLLDELESVDFNNCDLINTLDIKQRAKLLFDSGGEHGVGQDLWVGIQPYLIDKANKLFSNDS